MELQPASGSDPFAQQGSLDWVGLSRASVSFSVDVLGRFMSAGVSPLTVVVGQAVAQKLPLSNTGAKEIGNALSKLKCYQGIGQAVWFGFGLKSFVRTLGTTSEGASLVAICSAASEIFGVDSAAEIISKFVVDFRTPDSLTPSIHEWSLVATACCGILAPTKFPVHYEGLRRLLCLPDMTSRYGSPNATDMSRALRLLSRVIGGELQSISIEGGIGACWIAAVAEWLYGLKVDVYGGDGDLLYQSGGKLESTTEAQVVIRFPKEDSVHKDSVELVACTYRIADDLQLLGRSGTFVANSGRLPWSSCLRDVFGRTFDTLMSHADKVGHAFGCFARLLQVSMDSDLMLASVHNMYGRMQAQFDEAAGLPFILNSIAVLPELGLLQAAATSIVSANPRVALLSYCRTMVDLSFSCTCRKCGPVASDPSAAPLALMSFSMGEDRNCLWVLLCSILKLSQILAGVRNDSVIRMKPTGLLALYDSIAARSTLDTMSRSVLDHRLHLSGVERGMQIADVIAIVSNETTLPYDVAIFTDTQLCESMRLDSLATIFIGTNRLSGASREENTQETASAVTGSGITIFYDILQTYSTDRQVIGKVTLVAGHLGYGSRAFPRQMKDLLDRRENLPTSLQPERMSMMDPTTSELVRSCGTAQERLHLLTSAFSLLKTAVLEITETPSSISAHFVLQSDPQVRPPVVASIAPRELISQLVTWRQAPRHSFGHKKCSTPSFEFIAPLGQRFPSTMLRLVGPESKGYYGNSEFRIALAFTHGKNDFFDAAAVALLDNVFASEGGYKKNPRVTRLVDEENCLNCTLTLLSEQLIDRSVDSEDEKIWFAGLIVVRSDTGHEQLGQAPCSGDGTTQ